jgi:large-conductance mechanosensitive channel
MPEAVVTEFIKVGIVGAIAIALAIVCWRLFLIVQRIMEARLADQREFSEKYLEALNANTAAMDRIADLAEARQARRRV